MKNKEWERQTDRHPPHTKKHLERFPGKGPVKLRIPKGGGRKTLVCPLVARKRSGMPYRVLDAQAKLDTDQIPSKPKFRL